MKKNIITTIFQISIATMVVAFVSCKKDYSNPNAAPEEQVFSSARGITGVAIGLQRNYSLTRAGIVYNNTTATGFITNELFLINSGNLSEDQLNRGGVNVDGTNTIVAGIWTTANKIIYDANRVIQASQNLGDKGYASGLIGYATIFKALSLGNLSMYWEKIPDTTGSVTAPVNFIDRNVGYNRAIAAIDLALSAIASNPISGSFAANIPAGINIPNTLQALKARYALFAGNYTQSYAAAGLVDLTVKSTFNYDASSLNPIFETATSTNNVFSPIDSTLGLPVGLRPDPNDKRVQFYTTINPTIAPRFRINGFGATATTAIPLYLPDEIRLIRAECLVRQTSLSPTALADANALIDGILTQAPAADPFGVGAQLPAYSGPADAPSLLTEIYRNRCIELFMSGQKIEDMRRFARPLTERKRNFFPYPFRERDGNTNTPPDPGF